MKTNNNTVLGIFVLLTIVIVTIATFSLGCAEPPTVLDNETETTDQLNGEYVYNNAVVEDTEILILESFPVQIHVIATGYLPDGCTQIHEKNIEFNDQKNTFTINITTTRPADAICTEAIVPFENTIVLDVYGLEKGIYTVDVNGITNEFELQTDNIIPE
ncbi:hypothetical protein RE476_01740 [Methanolobus mangrovi]|uniref:Uncharacterized protein n=1 Tax=Methanolobus mangrovi TaxID=3072977 RepID=A0AA51UG53_9EURY|nr:hypothetical protein [Methanolobus mangrovi]WMW22566.1 hypothetical protein RE476_01740 [Methanolobus mangrovi]